MSLLYGPNGKARVTLAALWRDAHKSEAGEPEALSFWQHYLVRHEFLEDHWVCDAEIRPEPLSRSRIDRGIRYLAEGNEIIVLCWIEGKGKNSKAAMREVEEQARLACKRYLDSHSWQDSIYAFTTILTMGKAWTYTRDEGVLTSMHDDDYIEANSNEGYKLSKCFARMKSFPPTPPAEAPNSSIANQPNFAAPNPAPVLRSGHSQKQSNPIFPRSEPSQVGPQKSTTKDVTAGLRYVEAMRDPRKSNACLFKVHGGWKALGRMKQGKKDDGKDIIYSSDDGIWFYVDDLRK